MKWRIFFLNIDKLSELPMAGSSLFHSEIVEGKKEFLKKLCLTLKKGMLCIFLEVWDECLTLAKTNNIKEKARPTACNFTKKWIPSKVHFKDFCQKIFSFRSTSKWFFPSHSNNLKITVCITLFSR